MIDHSLSVDDGAVWEPWTPKVGDRVRVRLSAECDLRADPDSYAVELGVPHWPATDGATGTIVSIGDADWLTEQGHPYDIRFDQWFELPNGGGFNHCDHAITEIEPLDGES